MDVPGRLRFQPLVQQPHQRPHAKDEPVPVDTPEEHTS